MRWLVLFSFIFMQVARPQIYSRSDVLHWQEESRVEIKKFVALYNTAIKDFARKGPLAFAEHFKNLDEAQKKWLIKQANKIESFPQLELRVTTLVFKDESGVLAELPVKEVAAGVFSLPQRTLRYNFRKSLEENHREWTRKKTDVSALLNFIFIPQAQAVGKVMAAGIGALVCGLLAHILFKKSSTELGAQPEVGGGADNHALAGGGGGDSGGGGGGGVGGTTGAPGAGTTGEPTAPPPGSDSGGKPSDGLKAEDFPKAGDDLLAGCAPFVDPYDAAAVSKLQGDQKIIYDIIGKVERNGGYSANAKNLTEQKFKDDVFNLYNGKVANFGSSNCSAATYPVYMAYLMKKNPNISNENFDALVPKGNVDGEGPWGYWNANGPGTGAYFHESGAGNNFARTEGRQPGAFLKILWKQGENKEPALGVTGHPEGHSVIFLGCKGSGDAQEICTWSSHESDPAGVGVKCYPKSRLGMLVYSEPNGNIPKANRLERNDTLVKLKSPKNNVQGRDNVVSTLQQLI